VETDKSVASSVELADRIAVALGLASATVQLHARNAREAAILSYGGRGRNAARMTATDAASLLIIAAASLAPKDSVDTFNAYAPMPLSIAVWEPGTIPSLDALPKNHTFVVALTNLIEATAAGELDSDAFDEVVVEMYWPWAGARIKVLQQHEMIHRLDYGRSIARKPGGGGKMTSRFLTSGDLEQERRFSGRTLHLVSNVLRS
jgi:hypothetical protein